MNRMNLEVLNEKAYPVDEQRLIEAVSLVLDQHEIDPESGLTIVITDNEEVAGLNLQFRGIDAPTDVLSFPADEPPEEVTEDEPPYLGDVIIAHPYALAQAERENHAPNDSFTLLVVHGTLHLLGYDHDTPENRAGMWAAQEKALRTLNIPLDIVPSLEGKQDDEEQAH
jgi:probable rRNA maturation factor